MNMETYYKVKWLLPFSHSIHNCIARQHELTSGGVAGCRKLEAADQILQNCETLGSISLSHIQQVSAASYQYFQAFEDSNTSVLCSPWVPFKQGHEI